MLLWKLAILFLVFVGTTTYAQDNTNTNNINDSNISRNQNDGNDSTVVNITNSGDGTNIPTFKIGMVADQFLKYAIQDNQIYNGTKWWADWVNNRGGIVYDGVAHQVEVIALDASTPNPTLVRKRIMDAYCDLAVRYNVHLLLSPATTDRTAAALEVSNKHKIINLAAGTLGLFNHSDSYLFSSAVYPKRVPAKEFKALLAKGAKTFVIVQRTDSIAVTQGTATIEYLQAHGMTMVKQVWLNSSATDLVSFDSDLRNCFTTVLKDVVADVFIYASLQSEFSVITTVFEQMPLDVKAAVFLVGISRYEQEFRNLGNTGDMWITATRFDPSFQFGVSGEYGGTTAEFVDDFQKSFGFRVSHLEALSSGLLMAYYRAVTLCGTINSSEVRATMRSMSKFETFAFPVEFDSYGTNIHTQFLPLQFIDGEGRPLTDSNFVYPALWRAPPRSKSSHTFKIVAIVIPIGLCILVVVAIGITYIQRQRKRVVIALEQAEEGERRNYKIDFGAITVGKLLGAGGAGEVYKGEYRGADVAIKKLTQQSMSQEQLEQFAKESSVMIGLRHPNILLFMGVCVDPPGLCIITEYCTRGSLQEIIHNNKINLPVPLMRNMLEDTLKGLLFIHAAGFIHRDFKSPNLLVDRNWTVKISDFGLSCLSKSDAESHRSLLWTAPEVLSNQHDCYSEKSDIYGFGIVVWEMIARSTPFAELTPAAIPHFVVSGLRPPLDPSWSPVIKDLISKCWDPSPANRPSVKEARCLVDALYVEPDFSKNDSRILAKRAEKIIPPSGEVTFVHTVVQNVKELWEWDPRITMRSLLVHNAFLRALMEQHKGYEVKSNGEEFMIAFPSPILAINYCLRVQIGLLKIEWPDILLRFPGTKEIAGSKAIPIFKGLTIKMGIHVANPTCEKNSETGTMDYFGHGVTRASRLAAIARKGRIVVDARLYATALTSIQSLDPFVIHSLGRVMIQKSPTDIYEMIPEALKGRIDVKDQREETTLADDTPDSNGNFEFAPHKERWIVSCHDIQAGERIGVGSFGEVRVGTCKGERVAIKLIIKRKRNDVATLELRSEGHILSMLKHENVLTFKGMCLQEPHVCLITEYMENGSLARILHGSASSEAILPWDLRKRMAMDIAKGMAYLHSKSIIHRDVKSGNLLINAEMRVKIADFGFSRMKAENHTMTQCGTVAWTAPEIFEGHHYSEPADVYSFGVVLWEIIFRSKPWVGVHSMRITQSVIAGERPSTANQPANTPPKMVSLMESCWAQSPQKRPTFDEIIKLLEEF